MDVILYRGDDGRSHLRAFGGYTARCGVKLDQGQAWLGERPDCSECKSEATKS